MGKCQRSVGASVHDGLATELVGQVKPREQRRKVDGRGKLKTRRELLFYWVSALTQTHTCRRTPNLAEDFTPSTWVENDTRQYACTYETPFSIPAYWSPTEINREC